MERFNQACRRAFAVVATSSPLLALATPTGPDFSGLTDAVDFSTVVTAVLAIGALIAVALVAKKGARMVLSMIGR